MRGTALAVSPHLDDAIFSCGGTLARLAGQGWSVTVATMFTASVAEPRGFALDCQLDKGLGPEVDYMALRRAEDAAACRALGLMPPVWLPFREAPHRGYGSAPALFAGVRDDDTIDQAIAAELERLLGAIKPDLVLAPQAVGAHVDHVQVVRALHALPGLPPVLWWTDFPYAVRPDTPLRAFGAAMNALSPVEVPLSDETANRKRLACQAYASQIGFQFGGAAGLDRHLAAAGDVESFRGEARAVDLLSRGPTAAPAPHAAGSTSGGR